MSRETQIAALVEKCLDHLSTNGGDIPIAKICAQAPELQQDVSRAIDMARSLPQLGAKALRLDPRLGTLIADRYRLDARLGAGAMGLVYEAADLDLGRQVALKLMRTDIAVRDTSIARFEREATTLAAVRHEAVVTVFDRGIASDGTPFLAMDLIEGVPCSTILEEAERRREAQLDGDDDSSWLTESFGIETASEPSFLRQVLRWAADIASGLAAAHEAGIVHRDLKPSNIIIRPDNRAVLIDFGIATADDFRSLTGEDELVGTPAYMAPEALRGSQALGPQADVYGLAATLYHLLTLQAPFRGSVNQILTAIATRDPMPASRVRPGIPRGAQAILDHGMARTESSRYASLSAMESDIRALLAHRQVSVRPTSNFVRLVRRARRSKALIGAASAALVIAGALGFRQWTITAADSRRAVFEEAWPILPSNLGFVLPENRPIRDPELRAEVAESLDRLVACGEQKPTGLALRAFFRIDNGDNDGALADFARIARQSDDPAVDAIQESYARALSDPATPVSHESWPEPSTPAGLYLGALHFMREQNGKEASRALADPRLDDLRHVKELRMFLRSFRVKTAKTDSEVDRLANALVADAQEELRNSGYDGASIYHVICQARLLQGRFGASLDACKQGIAKSPASFTLRQNGAYAALQMGRTHQAMHLIDQALELAPKHLALAQIRAEIQTADRDFEGARATLRAAPYERNPRRGEALRTGQLLLVDIAEAYSLMDGPEDELFAACGAVLETAGQLPEDSPTRKDAESLVDSIQSRDKRPLFQKTLGDLVDEPTSLYRVKFMLSAWPGILNETDGELIHQWATKLGRSYESLVSVPKGQ